MDFNSEKHGTNSSMLLSNNFILKNLLKLIGFQYLIHKMEIIIVPIIL